MRCPISLLLNLCDPSMLAWTSLNAFNVAKNNSFFNFLEGYEGCSLHVDVIYFWLS